MRTHTGIAAIALCVSASLAGCVTHHYRDSNARAVDDATISANVKSALLQDPETRSKNISVNTLDGKVELSGFVDSTAERHEAERVAGNVAGVRSVQNQLQVNGEGSRTVAAATDDQTITSQVRSALASDPSTASPRIHVATADGVVQLSGFVDSNETRDNAGSIARSVPGVRRVDNDLRLNPND